MKSLVDPALKSYKKLRVVNCLFHFDLFFLQLMNLVSEGDSKKLLWARNPLDKSS